MILSEQEQREALAEILARDHVVLTSNMNEKTHEWWSLNLLIATWVAWGNVGFIKLNP